MVTYAPGTVKFLEEYVGKGDLIEVVGMLRNESWQDPQGRKRQATKIAVTGAGHRIEKLASPPLRGRWRALRRCWRCGGTCAASV